MLSFPVNVALTVAFAFTGLYCLGHLVASRRRTLAGTGPRTLTDGEVVDLNHGIMSAAMILMTWVVVSDAFLWTQVALFAILAASLLLNWVRAGSTVHRIDVVTHILLDLAMIWMLAAMPLLMAELAAGGGGHDHHGGHHGVAEAVLPAVTPLWADIVNGGFVVISVAVCLWWIGRLVTGSGHRWHAACHAVMAGGMGVMLLAMNS